MKLIPLTRGLVAKVDDEDYEFLMQYKWNAVFGYGTYYARRYHYPRDGTRALWVMHRIIMKVNDPKIIIDHDDRDGLNNQKQNLILSNKSLNAINSERSDKAEGIYYESGRDTYKAFLLNPRRYIGTYPTYEGAKLARDRALKEQHK